MTTAGAQIDDAQAPRPRGGAGLLAWTGLLVALLASAVLAADHLALFGAALPGCGAEGGCAELTAGRLGRVPGTDWPWSFLGLMHFGALALAWRGARPAPGGLRLPAAVGALGSLALLGLMGRVGTLCPWCLAAHLGNLLFVVALGRAGGDGGGWRRGLPPYALAAAGLGVALGLGAESRRDAMDAARERALSADTAAITAGTTRRALVGRHLLGSADAPIHVVIFSDYACPWCRGLEGELTRLVSTRGDVSASMKHFPMSQECQPWLTKDSHPDSCRAARAAEAAGLLGGAEAFWGLHGWLFRREGHFDDAELSARAVELGLDPLRLLELTDAPTTLELVQADVAEAHDLGILKTPMVFVNGVELRTWDAPEALTRAVEALAAAIERGEARPVDAVPPPALPKSVGDWRAEPRQVLPADLVGWTWWNADGATPPAEPVEVVIWGDLLQSQTRELMQRLREAGGDDVRVRFRHNPVDQGCMTSYAVPARAEGACRAALVADAAGRLGGEAAYAAACRALLTLDGAPDDAALDTLAPAWGLDADELHRTLREPATAAAVSSDIMAARKLSMNRVPMLFVDDRWAPRWKLPRDPDAPLIEALLAAARSADAP